MNKVKLTDIRINPLEIVIAYSATEPLEAWLENTNKHYPHILSLTTDSEKQIIVIDRNDLRSFLECYPGHNFKLSLCNARLRLPYIVSEYAKVHIISDFHIALKDQDIIFRSKSMEKSKNNENGTSAEIYHVNPMSFKQIEQLPINILNIGSCFSRSIFKSDDYFNPMYKDYFYVKNTLFHNSFISLFSDSIPFDYTSIDDLNSGDSGKYVGIEFRKNIGLLLNADDQQVVVVDNYIDAAVPIIQFNQNTYLTYNKYFSESIFKRFFSSCDVIYPGTEAHMALYRKSISAFHDFLDACHIQNVVLIGGRLSKYKMDEVSRQIDRWDNKMDWVTEVNRNWDIADCLFLQEFPNAIYLDKRSTSWMSDVHSPIKGGASPSHYQSGYYKELFEDLLQYIDEDLTHGK